jgi:3-phenylpropionate/cinnamic acid dioxygenase small subunit
MSDATDQIRNLLHRYSEAVDTGNFDALAELFAHARFRSALGNAEPTLGRQGAEVAEMFKTGIILYGDGTPRTRHVVTNSIIEVDEQAGTATARSYNTTLQQVPPHPLEIMATARYEDRFERVGGTWRFTDRVVRHSSIDGVHRDFINDMSRHTRSRQARS